jgi:predicted aspartyl protease
LLFASPTTRDRIGRVVVPVTINGKGPFRFIVDTGANHSTISPGLVQTLGLQPSDEASVVLDGITGSAKVTFVTVDRLQAGDMTIEGTALPVVSADVMGGADGILGAAGFTTKSLMVDFQHNRVAIARSVAAAVRTEATKIHALRLTHGLITLETRVGGLRVQAVLDTGSQRTLGNLALRDALRMPGARAAVVQVTSVYGATERIEAGEIRIAPTIAIDSLRITDVGIVYGDFHIFKVWEMADKPAMIIGMDVLGTVPVLGIDFERQDVYLAGVRGKGGEDVFQAMHGYNGNSAIKK